MAEETKKPATITSKETKIIGKAKGLYKFTFNEEHGTYDKDQTVEMHLSTAKALEAHKIGKVGDKVKFVEKKKQ